MSDSTLPPMIFGGEFKGGGIGIFLELANIGWRIEPGRQDPANPLIVPKYPWDINCFGSGTVSDTNAANLNCKSATQRVLNAIAHHYRPAE